MKQFLLSIQPEFGGSVRPSDGMTTLELLIAITLFSTFMSVFVVVTEMTVAWIPTTTSPSGTNHCTGQGLEQACVNAALDRMVESLEMASFEDVYNEARLAISDDCWKDPRSRDIYNASGLEWPDSYRVCLVKEPGSSETDPSAPDSFLDGVEMPGLYLLQASPTDDAFWRKPIQRLVCRPIYLCVNDQSLS